jgi:hypothetical protein
VAKSCRGTHEPYCPRIKGGRAGAGRPGQTESI